MQMDEAVPRALRRLLGDHWRDRLQAAVAREMAPPKAEPKRRNLSPEERQRRREQMLAINARRSAERAQSAPPPPATSPGFRAAATRAANAAARAATDMTDPALNAEEQHEARARLAKGEGARELHDWFGGGLGWWQAWCERERAGQRSAA